jgi:transcriptional regulator with XRE-family HTH domain
MPRNRADSQAVRAAAFGARLRQLRRAARLTQRQVAERVPMSAGNLSRIENGEQGPPSDEVVAALAGALGADAEELLALATRRGDRSDQLLREIRELRQEVRAGFARVEAELGRRE